MAKLSPAYDSQREEVYRMEQRGLKGINQAYYKRSQLRKLLAQLSREFDLDPPILHFKRSTAWSGIYQLHRELGYAEIILSTSPDRSGLSPLTLVHEFAHHVIDSWAPSDKLQPHGAEFLGVYGDCCAMAGLVPYEGFRALCKQYKVDFLDTLLANTVPRLRKLVKKREAEASLTRHPPTNVVR